MNELISVIVPVYNVEKYLERCLDSIINQTYHNLEIILINDGSTDNSLDICKKYQKLDSRIRVYSQKNKGLSYTRNRGIKLSKGKYIGFVDSDDVISNYMYEYLYRAIKENNTLISLCGFVRFSNNPEFDREYQQIKLSKEEALKELLIDREIANHAVDKLYARELFNDILFPVGLKFEDIFVMYKIFLKCDYLSYVPLKLYGYYYREGSITGQYSKDNTKTFLNVINSRYDELKNIKELNLYADMNKVNTVLRCFLDIVEYKKITVLKDKEYKQLLYKELDIAKKLNTSKVKKINTKRKNILLSILFISPYLFYYVMIIYFKIKK